MQGMLESQPFRLTVEFSESAFHVVRDPDTLEFSLDRVVGIGQSPYFVLGLELASIGHILGDYTLALDSSASRKPDHLDDENVVMVLRLGSGGQNVGFSGLTGSGELVLDNQNLDSLQGRFTGGFGSKDDTIEGCFRIFALETFLTRNWP